MKVDPAQVALRVVNHISALVAYWDRDQRCVFSNNAYTEWLGKTPEEMAGMRADEVLGPTLYEMNRPYIQAALQGEVQVFERRLTLPGGGFRDAIITYTPDIVAGEVLGLSIHVADVTLLRQREAELERAIQEKEEVLAEVKELTGLLPICAWCKKIRADEGYWTQLEKYVESHTKATFTHGICPDCVGKLQGQ
ncbi:MAG TPA: PAS domain-containing protein [Ramlibacter sp.]|nr:PAS domain-containing protein [Ramlibacter sp.]